MQQRPRDNFGRFFIDEYITICYLGSVKKAEVLFWICVAFLGGVFISSLIRVSQEFIWGLFIFGCIIIVVFFREKKIMVIGLCLLIFAGGIVRHQHAVKTFSDLARYNDMGEMILTGTVLQDPDERLKSTQLTIHVEKILLGAEEIEIDGKMRVTAQPHPTYRYGDVLRLHGRLETPAELGDFDYGGYLAKDGIYSVMSFPEIKKISEDKGNPVYGAIFTLKGALRESLFQSLPSPESEILSGILLGDQRRVGDDLIEKFNTTGTRHIMAISGMNITIVSELILFFFLALGFWRHHALFLAIAAISFFIIMIGAPASAVRAGVMAGVLLIAQNLGRPKNETRAILYAAVVMVFFNPALLRFDAGFQLSFLAIIGIVFFSKYLGGRLTSLPHVFGIRETVSMTIAAQLATLPILIYNFGNISLVSLPANILIVPFLPFLMIAGFVTGVLGIVSQVIGEISAWPIWIMLTYILTVIDFFAQFPLASFRIDNMHWGWILIYYFMLFWFWRTYIREKSVLETVKKRPQFSSSSRS